jgi:hypothetical protein
LRYHRQQHQHHQQLQYFARNHFNFTRAADTGWLGVEAITTLTFHVQLCLTMRRPIVDLSDLNIKALSKYDW